MVGPKVSTLGGISLNNSSLKSDKTTQANNFNSLFNQALQGATNGDIKISAHAQKRLSERNITMDSKLETSLKNAVEELESKGAKDSLVITKEGAFLVNVPNKTLVTAMGHEEMRDGIVTNIDSVSMKYQ
jgi:flagellar operon protein